MKVELTYSELNRLAHHLEVAANRYDEHAESVCVKQVAESFKVQAADSRYLASMLRLEANKKKPAKVA